MTNQNKDINWEKRVVKVSRVSKVVKGGKKISFRATATVLHRVKSSFRELSRVNFVKMAHQ